MQSATTRCLPRDVHRALLVLARAIQSAPDELVATSRGSGAESASTLAAVSQWLYGSWYCRLPAPEAPLAAWTARTNLASALRASTAASTRWEPDWVAVRAGLDGVCVAGRGTETREVHAGDYANLVRPGLPVAPGDRIALRAAIEWTDPATGFWWLRSGEPRLPLARVYFSVTWQHAGYVLSAVTTALDGASVPYSLKCPSEAGGFARIDSLIVYLDTEAWSTAAPIIKETSHEVARQLRGQRPPLTKRVARGVAFAEDPGDGRSFGESRCAALAPGVQRLMQDQAFSMESGVAALAASLEAAGVNPACPWANGGARA